MDNYGSPSHYPHHHPYGYPPPPPNPAYPPPYPYPYHASNYAYPPHYPPPPPPTSYSGPLDYPQQSVPPVPAASHSGPLDYHHHGSQGHAGSYPYQYPSLPASPSHQPSLQQHSSFQYGSAHYHYQQQPSPEAHSNVPSRTQSFSGHQRLDSSSSFGTGASQSHETVHDASPNYPSIYPPLDDLLGTMRISEGHSTAPASPPAPAISQWEAPSPNSSFDNRANFYGYPNDSFSSSWEENSGRYDASPHSAYVHSSSFNGSQHSQSLEIVPLQHPKGSLKVLLLHGNLDIWVYEARSLPNMDMFHKTLGDVFSKLPGNVQNKIEGHMNTTVTSDPYVTISVSNAVIGRTYVMSNSENPVWKQHFYVPVAHNAAEVHFVVKDSDVLGSQIIGVVAIPVEQIFSGAKIEGTYPILNSNGKPCKPGAVLSLSIQYTPIESLSTYHHGVGAGPDYHGVPGTYFPLRKGGTVTLYQDAHVPDGLLPTVKLDGGMYYANGKCWQDIFDAIRHARKLIYITGWAVWHKVRLVRDAASGSDSTLGELLRTKSQEGVRVLLLVWDDPTSRNILGYKTVSTLPLNAK